MSELNNGAIRVPAGSLNKVIDAFDKYLSYFTGTITRKDFYISEDFAEYEVTDISGDMSEALTEFTEELDASGIVPEISIAYDDGYGGSGEYRTEYGRLTAFTAEEIAVRNADTAELIAELKRRKAVMPGRNRRLPRYSLNEHIEDLYEPTKDVIFKSDDLESLKSLGETIWNSFIGPVKGCVELADYLSIDDGHDEIWRYAGPEEPDEK